MSATVELLKAIDSFEKELRVSANLPQHNRKEMVQVRRRIANHVMRIASLIPERCNDSQRYCALRKGISKVRHAMAYHQASWPIVSIDFSDPDYLSSVRAMREVNRSFVDEARTALAKQLDTAGQPLQPPR